MVYPVTQGVRTEFTKNFFTCSMFHGICINVTSSKGKRAVQRYLLRIALQL
jgi:hypothetical protein